MRFEHVGLAPHFVDYQAGWDYQREVHAKVVAGELEDTVLLLEHSPTYTAGKRTQDKDRPKDGTPVIDVDRGGKITWHGPGQLVGYPIVHLPNPIDVVAHVRRLEQAIMNVCDHFGVPTMLVEGRSGVWVAADERGPERKVAAIGIRVTRDVTMHGFAINANCDLSWAQNIIPCGLDDAGATSLSFELGRDVTVTEILPVVEREIFQVISPYTSVAEQAHRAADRVLGLG
ncbi:lipoyl(octanoyl) transferase LipB [Dermatophilus congolensis]|uniref:Octanoyltransferase n=1 Tax=Dermatophilus congolensis TaxID=1863 RepID=A0A239VMK3_9MICO|nr:lipoyl(octanoyl) transferase LipB [Dermatophilus congolensis]MBO3129541.1 lipoyl(octanoyl) transferase LipB [Dermatophilus congolensis]MBO3131826.1 lipoyl(octanoyl) transferase LipB [Dermatophilus congolensis]MBO3134017.1 lipoyl(octanoyl) transferase LipB [Dermatophilus congolensis]MBO3136249.1 lipoyl(octanoyl) transferase LipB [Dermatophilus congolensis]MBO3138496.1 lipoyl(octanoyl) transferase LipB [Dermatophilus congolensis]